ASSLTALIAGSGVHMTETVVSAMAGPDELAGYASEVLSLTRQTGRLSDQAFAEISTGASYTGFGQFGQGLAHARESMRIATDIEHQQWTAGAHHTLGQTYLAMLEPSLALHHLEAALALARKLGSS